MRHSEKEPPVPLLILGAGPAGLSLGVELQRRGVPFVIVERGGPGESWRRMPTHLKLVSPWKASWLAGTGRNEWPRHAAVSRAQYWAYLQQLAATHGLPIRTGVEVVSIQRDSPGGFSVATAAGEILSARQVVNATGCFQNPFIPEFRGARLSRIPQCHVADYGDPRRLAEQLGKARLSVLLVGKRLSAGQAMVELVEAGHKIWISHRAPIQFGSGPIGWWIFFRVHPWLESLKLKWQGPGARGYDVRMPGGRARDLVGGGHVTSVPPVDAFGPDHVILEGGERLQPDVVLYATGYRPALGHLVTLGLTLDPGSGRPALNQMESSDVPGLFFLGLDGLRNFQSRFLRGIRQDAAALADKLQCTFAAELRRFDADRH